MYLTLHIGPDKQTFGTYRYNNFPISFNTLLHRLFLDHAHKKYNKTKPGYQQDTMYLTLHIGPDKQNVLDIKI